MFTRSTHSQRIFEPEVAFTEIINFDFAYPVDLGKKPPQQDISGRERSTYTSANRA
jgi:hypothetical protein